MLGGSCTPDSAVIDNQNAFTMSASQSKPLDPLRARLHWLVGAGFFGIVGLGVGLLVHSRAPSINNAEAALDRGESVVAHNIALQVLEADPTSAKALIIAGKAALAQQQYETVLSYFDRLEDDGSSDSIKALLVSAKIAIQLGRLRDAEQYLRRVLAHNSSHLEANEHILSLLRIEGRSWEALPHALQLCRQRRYVVEYLELAGILEATWIDRDQDLQFLDFCAAEQPDDPLAELGPLRMLMQRQSALDLAEKQLGEIVASHPNIIEAQAMLGQLRLASADDNRFLAWHSQLPASADQHPTVWLIRGRWQSGHGNTRAAVRCLWESLQRHPNDRAANLLVANLLASLGENELAAGFQQRGENLQAFDNLLLRGPTENGRRTAETISKMIQWLERLGRRWEALGWSHHLLEVDPDSQFAQAAIFRLSRGVDKEESRTLAPLEIVDLSGFPLPDWESKSSLATREPVSASAISFDDMAATVGLKFEFFVDHQRMRNKVFTFDFAGGGVGVLDYDQDGWPDLYLTQGSRWPHKKGAWQHRNCLFRNLSGQSFEQVGDLASVGDTGFGAGPTVGDINCDGFPDIFVANVGTNCLYLNNGDGTFRDSSESIGNSANEFSLSAVIVDLNRDQLPDLYVVNYLGGDALTRQCRVNGRLIQCSPLDFPGQQDRLYLNRGDGHFDEKAGSAGIAEPDGAGKGMGVLAADVDGTGGIDLFITNDTTANLLFVNETHSAGGVPKMSERGSIAGVAYDDLGRLQGSMGIAAGDVTADGLVSPSFRRTEVAGSPLT